MKQRKVLVAMKKALVIKIGKWVRDSVSFCFSLFWM